MSLHVTAAPSEADRQAVLDGLIAFNSAVLGALDQPPVPLAVLWRDDAGAPAGGAIGRSWGGWVFIELLHLPERLRGRGVGRQVMDAIEAEARARGCMGVYLDTFSFQARPFYEKLGYTVFGTLEGMPFGYDRFWLAKRF